MAPAEQDALAVREQLFHDRVRECIICALLFTSLYILCHFIITHFKKHTDFTAEHDDEDAAVNRIALGLCTFTLAVALGAVLLLPFSIISNEVLLSFPQNYYIQWLNGSLVHGLWNLVFLFSNLSLVFLMPFAYFFTESEGFAGSKKGIMARVYETSVVLLLLTLLVLGMVWVASAIVGNDAASRQSLYDLWEYYLPYLYSCISLFGVLLLLRESWDVPLRCPGTGGPSCLGCGSPGVPSWEQGLLPANCARRGPEGTRCRAEPPVPIQDPSGGAGLGRMLGHPLLSLSSHCSMHPLRPLHHVHRHREAAGETPAPGRPGGTVELHKARGSCHVPSDLLWQSFLLAELECGAAAGAVLRHSEQEAEAGAAAPSITLAEEPGLPAGHAGPPGTDGHLCAHRLHPRPGAAAGRCRDATGHAGCIPGPGLLLHLWFLRSCPAGRPHLLPDGLLRRGLLQLPSLHPAAPQAAGYAPHQDHRELRLLAGAQLGPARLLQDAGDHPFRPPGGLRPFQLVGELLHCLPLQHGLRGAHHPLPGEEGLLGRPGRAHLRLRSAQAAAACDTLPPPRQALLGLGDKNASPLPPWWPAGWLPATERALMVPGASGMSEYPRES